ncbi:MAG TPA: MFS transporter, partial [Candidatus Binataceae bacterium]|nr:MFS transporter [Candidatus Binataceae bacterium]
AATLASRVTTKEIRLNLVAGLLVSAAGIIAFGMSPWIVLSLAAQLIIGGGLSSFRAGNSTLVQLYVSNDLRGRVMSTYQLAAVGMTPIGALAVGYLGTAIGPRESVLICGAVTVACGIAALTRLTATDPAVAAG